jgi:Tol biopolymer transport system component
MVRRRLPRGLLLTASLVALALGLPESVGAARNGLIAYSVDEGEETCDQCGPQGESLPLLGGAWVETVRPDGTDRRRIRCAYLRPSGCRYRDPVFSHDGRRLAVASREGLVVLTPSGNRVLRLQYEEDFISPAWAPGNRKLAFARSLSPPERAPDGGYAFGIYLTDLSGRTRLLKRADTLSVTWSRRGLLAWASPPFRSRWPDIWVGRPDGSGGRRIARRGDFPAWSPDGRSVAFMCRGAGRGLCVVPASGGEVRLITRSCTFGWDDYTGIAWSPDGREIACEGKRGGLIAVNLGTQAVRAIVRPRWMSASIQEIDWQPIPAADMPQAAG